jgi:polyphosphate kinase
MVRVAGLMGLADAGVTAESQDGLTPTRQLAAINERAGRLLADQQRIWHDLVAGLREESIAVLDLEEVTEEEWAGLRERFADEALAVLTPIAIDPAHPFPFIGNCGMGSAAAHAEPGRGLNRARALPSKLTLHPPPGEAARYLPLEAYRALDRVSSFPLRVKSTTYFRVIPTATSRSRRRPRTSSASSRHC